MFAQITTLQLQPGKLDEFIRIFQDAIAPAAAAQQGFGGITLLSDPPIGKVIAVGLWETEAEMLAGEIGSDEEQFASVSSLLAEPPAREVYEVSVHVELTEQGSARIRGI
jgi:heme-degrading monooxygenase HmoA